MCNKSKGADNQQERLIQIGWVLGFVDGEGCFSISLVRQKSKNYRKGYKTGYQVFHEFAVTQGKKSLESLKLVQNFFRVGKIYRNKRYDNHKEHLYKYVVRSREDILKTIIPFFREYSLRTSKNEDFEKFAQCMSIVACKRHLKIDGLLSIIEIVETMNRKKSHKNLIRILRDYTPNIDSQSMKI